MEGGVLTRTAQNLRSKDTCQTLRSFLKCIGLIVFLFSSPASAQEQEAAAAQQVTLPPPAQPAQPTAPVSTYTINPGDEIEIYVWGEERLQRVLHVLPDGTVAFPLVGQLRVAGEYPQTVERLVAERLRDQYRGDVPVVTVSVRNPAGLQFSVIGKVRAPGSFTASRYINLLDALSVAGGPAEFANLDSVLVIRRDGDQLTATRARLAALFRSGATTEDVRRANIIPIEPGDTVIVP